MGEDFASLMEEAVNESGIEFEDSLLRVAAQEIEEDEQTEELDDEEVVEEDDLEDDAEDDDAEEDDEESEEDEELEDEELVEVAEDTVLKLPDGSTTSLKDLAAGSLRQADYTRKTQEVARYRDELHQTYEKMTAWFQERESDPAGWVAEIAAGSGDVGTTLAAAMSSDGQTADATFAKVVRALVTEGKLSDGLVEQLGLGALAEKAKETLGEDRIARLERELQEERERKQQDTVQQQLVEQYTQEWAGILQTEGLQFESPEQEAQARYALMHFARENEISSLTRAWQAMAYEFQQRQRQEAPAPEVSEQAKKAVARKRETRAVTRQKAAGGRPAVVSKGDLDSAAEAAFAELGLQ